MPMDKPHPAQDWAHYLSHRQHGVELLRAHFLHHQFERHSHAEFSIGVTHSGVQSFHARGGLHHSQPGNVVAFNPDVAHDGMAGHETGFGYQMVYLQADVVTAWCQEYFADGQLRYVNAPLFDDAASAAQLQAAFAAMQQPQESLRAHNLLADGVLQLLSRHGGQQHAKRVHHEFPAWVRRVQDYLHSHYAQDITADELAVLAGVSRIHLNRVFTQATGSPPHSYLNTIRIHQAKQRLKAGDSAIEVAYESGFADQSHMIRRFKGALGITPKQWQKMQVSARAS
jgi:AraC-like DNA-binding protein